MTGDPLGELERALVEAAHRQALVLSLPRRPRRRPGRRPHGRVGAALAAALAILVLAAAALATSHLLSSAPPLPLGPGAALPADEGYGISRVATSQLLPIAVADPAGGPYWGLRFVGTTAGLGCLQAGLRVAGGLGVTGGDGVFGDDGRVHRLPPESVGGPFACAALDARGHAFVGVAITDAPASGLLTPTRAQPGCAAACPAGDQRLVYYGMAGPQAKSVTYVVDGHPRTQPTVGPQGAYLIVMRATSPGRERYARLPGAGGGPIRRIDYRNGYVCVLRNGPTVSATCPHVGQVAVRPNPVTTGAVRSPVRVAVVERSYGEALVVSFTPRVAALGPTAQYAVVIHFPGPAPSCGETYRAALRGAVAKGRTQHLVQSIGACRGRFRGTVSYRRGPNPDGQPGDIVGPAVNVGSFSIGVP